MIFILLMMSHQYFYLVSYNDNYITYYANHLPKYLRLFGLFSINSLKN